MSGTSGQEEEGFSLEQLYSQGDVYVFPSLFEPKVDVLVDDTKEHRFEEPDQSDPTKPSLPKKAKMMYKVDEAEFRVLQLVISLSKKMTKDTDPPVFVLHNVGIITANKLVGEVDILVINRKMGVVVIEVRIVSNTGMLQKRSKKVAEQLRKAGEAIRKELNGVVKPEGVTLVAAFPNLPSGKDADVIRCFQAHERKGVQGVRDLKFLVGQQESDYRKLLEGLASRADCDVWDTSSPHVDSPDSAFKMAIREYLSVARLRVPDDVIGKVADEYKSWILTPEQMEIRDSTERLLHISGPPGAGKTHLLQHVARRWLSEGKSVILAGGYDALQSHLGRSILKDQEEASSRLRMCGDRDGMERAVEEWGGPDLCVIIDGLQDDRMFKAVVKAVEAGRVQSCWSADMDDVTARSMVSARARQLGWKSEKLEESSRRPHHVVDFLNRLTAGSSRHSAIGPSSIPRPRLLTSAITLIDHSVHQHCVLCPPDAESRQRPKRELQCGQCKQELSEAMQPQDTVTKEREREREKWKQWVVLGTGKCDDTELEEMAAALRALGIPCVHEIPAVERQPHFPVSTPASRAQDLQSRISSSLSVRSFSDTNGRATERRAAWRVRVRERVMSGRDEKGRPTVHVVRVEDFRGLEKTNVVLSHFDKDDFDPSLQNRAAKTARLERHRDQWFQAASRCQGRLVIHILSPSPARSLLQLPEPPVYYAPIPHPTIGGDWPVPNDISEVEDWIKVEGKSNDTDSGIGSDSDEPQE